MHHALHHVRFRISPELHVVQDGVHGSPEPYMVRGETPILQCLYRLVTKTLKPIWESFSAMTKADSLVSNWPTLTR